MRKTFILVPLLLTGCVGLVNSNDGNTVVIESDYWISQNSLQETANEACIQSGKSSASYLTKANKNPSLGKGNGVQITTFKCL